MRLASVALVLALVPTAARAQVAIHVGAIDPSAPLLPAHLFGLTMDAAGHDPQTLAPCCFEQMAQMRDAAWHVPGGASSLGFHWLSGRYGCDWRAAPEGMVCAPPAGDMADGPSFDQFVAATLGVRPPIVTVNWEASDQEILNLVEYANAEAPRFADPRWTPTSYAEDAAAPPGYFAWLRAALPVGVKMWQLGPPLFDPAVDDRRTGRDPVRYARRAAALIGAIHGRDPSSLVGVVGGDDTWDRAMLAALKAAGVTPNYFAHASRASCAPHAEDRAAAEALMAEPDARAADVARIRKRVGEVYGAWGDRIPLVLSEFNAACAPTAWETENIWGAIYVARQFGEALRLGYTAASLYAVASPHDEPWGLFVGGLAGYSASWFGAALSSDLIVGASRLIDLRIDTDDAGAPALLSAYAVAEGASARRILLINREVDRDLSVTLSFDDLVDGPLTIKTYDGSRGGTAASSAASARFTLNDGPDVKYQHTDFAGQQILLPRLSIVVVVVTPGFFFAGDDPPFFDSDDFGPGPGPRGVAVQPASCGCRLGTAPGRDGFATTCGAALLLLLIHRRRARR